MLRINCITHCRLSTSAEPKHAKRFNIGKIIGVHQPINHYIENIIRIQIGSSVGTLIVDVFVATYPTATSPNRQTTVLRIVARFEHGCLRNEMSLSCVEEE